MMYVRIWFLLNILRINKQNSTKFCIHIVIDKIYVGILKCLFFAILQQCYGPRLTSEFGFAQYLENELTSVYTLSLTRSALGLLSVIVVNLRQSHGP